MTKEEALKLALEALENLINYDYSGQPDNGIDLAGAEAITAIKEALSQPAQEPVAWGYRNNDGAIYDCISPEAHADTEGDYKVPLYTTPPQRPWVGLTDIEMEEIWENKGWYMRTYKEIEAKLKEKNT